MQAILDGHAQRLEEHLRAELDRLDEEPERVRRGVELLAYMVAQGQLEIRVAFRRHSETGEPIRLEDSVDGYVHEKWGILTDAFGQKLVFSGSLNESAAALERNADEDRPSLFDRDLLVVSTGLLQRDERIRQLKHAPPFDVALVDEAHFARRQNARPGLDEEASFGKLYKGLQDERDAAQLRGIAWGDVTKRRPFVEMADVP